MIQAIGLTSHPRKELMTGIRSDELPARGLRASATPAPDDVLLLDDVSLEAPAGRVTALLSTRAAGRTALRLMLELELGRGITCFRGRPLHRIADPSREVGVVLGDVPGHPGRTVRGHLRMLCAAAGVPVTRADELLEDMGLVSLRGEPLGSLSRGLDRRLGMACALLATPHALVLDAPAHELAPREGRWLHGLLREHANRGGTVLFSTDDPKEAARTADWVITLDGGRVVADQEASDFARTRLRPRVAVRSPHAARLGMLLAKEARAEQRAIEAVQEDGNRLSVYGSSCAHIGEIAFRHGILVHQLADEIGDMSPKGPAAGDPPISPETIGVLARNGTAPTRHAGRNSLGNSAHPEGVESPTMPLTRPGPPSPATSEPTTSGAVTPAPTVPARAVPAGDQPDTRPVPATPQAALVIRPARTSPGTAGRPAAVSDARAAVRDVAAWRRPVCVRPPRGPLRPLRYELYRAAGIAGGRITAAAVLVSSALLAVVLARTGRTPQPYLLTAWPRELPLPPAALGAGLLGALAFGDEFRHPALAAGTGIVPRRLGLLAAKLLVAAVTAVFFALVTVGCDALLLHFVYGPELTQVPADWAALLASWLSLTVGCACAGVLAAGVFRSTAAGFAAVPAVPLVVQPLVHKALAGPSGRADGGIAARLSDLALLRWPFGVGHCLTAVVRMIIQPVGSALMLSLITLLCAFLFMMFRGRVR